MRKKRKQVAEEKTDINQSNVNSTEAQNNNQLEKSNNDLLTFFIGVILLGVGLFMFTNHVTVSSSWYNWGFMTFGGRNFSNGLVVLPLIIGIIMLFFNSKSVVAKIIITLGAVFIVATIIMSVNIRFERTSLYVYLIMLGMMAAGSGMLLRVLFKKR